MNENRSESAPVLVVGATGDLGGRVVRELVKQGKQVRALVREGSDADSLAAEGVEITRGDLLEPASLDRALAGARAVVTTATGYTRNGTSNPAVDDQGNRNLVDAAARAGLERFVFTSVATADQAKSVEVFWQKKLTEDYLERSGVPFVAIRPGTLVGGKQDFWERDLRKDRLTAFGDPGTPHTLVHIDDAAAYLARAVDEPDAVGRRIEIGMDHPVSNRELAKTFSKLRGREIKLRVIPWPLLSGFMRVAGLFSRKIRDFRSLLAYFASGKYVADTRAQAEVFGDTPSVDESLRHYLEEKRLGGMSKDAVIEAERVAKSYGEVQALAGVDLRVAEGTIVGLLGPNGAGKTTLVRILTTLLQPDGGRARIAGHDVCREPGAVRRVLGLAGQAAAVDGLLTGRENVELVGRLYGLSRHDARHCAQHVLERLGIADAADRLVRTYSGSMRRRLDLGASLVGRPRVLILDEPTTGLDPATRLELWELVAGFAREGSTVLLTTQYLEEADRLAARIVVIDKGRVIAEGTPDELKAKLGADMIDLRLRNDAAAEAAIASLRPIADGHPHWYAESHRLSLPAEDGAGTLIDALRRLDAAHVELEDVALRRPSLDDVFLALTGHAAEHEQAESRRPQRRRRRAA